MKLFESIIDDGKNVYKNLSPANSKKELLEIYGGNGTFEKIKEVTKDYFTNESPEKLRLTLIAGGWGEGEIKLICALLEEHIRKNA